MKQKAIFILAIIGILFGVYRVVITAKEEPPPKPLYPPAASPFPVFVAASGIIEATEENIKVQSKVAGLIEKILTSHGQSVKEGTPLLRLDDKTQRAVVERLSAEVAAAEERLSLLRNLPRPENVIPFERAVEKAEAQLSDAVERLKKLEKSWEADPGSVSADQLDQARHQVKILEATLGEAKANLDAIKSGAWKYEISEQEAFLAAKRAALKEALQILSQHTIYSPKKGTVLQINVRPGEWISPGQSEPPILMGRTDSLQIRADVDEVNAVEVRHGARAIAFVRGYTERHIPLEFVRIDPYVVQKKQLTGDTRERVDVRVLQVIYRFALPDFPVYPGQQVDVFIESAGRPEGKIR